MSYIEIKNFQYFSIFNKPKYFFFLDLPRNLRNNENLQKIREKNFNLLKNVQYLLKVNI